MMEDSQETVFELIEEELREDLDSEHRAAVKEKLRECYQLEWEITSLEETIKEARIKAYTISGPNLDGMPGGKEPGSKVERSAVKIADLEEEFEDLKKYQEKADDKINEILGNITDNEARQVMAMRYVDRMEWENIGEALYSRRKDYKRKARAYTKKVYNKHGEAIAELAGILAAEWPEFVDQSKDLRDLIESPEE